MAALSDHASIRVEIHELLLDGPLHEHDLVKALEENGFVLGDQPIAILADVLDDMLHDAVVILDGRWVLLEWAIESVEFTVDVPVDADARLPLGGTLQLLAGALRDERYVLDADGDEVGWVGVDDGQLLGPDGWLAAVAGRRAVLTVDAEEISIALDERSDVADPLLAAAFRRAFEAEGRQVCGVGAVMLRMSVGDHALVCSRVIPPIDALLADAGLELLGDEITAVAGADGEGEEEAAEQQVAQLASRYSISDDDATGAMSVLGAGSMFLDEGCVTTDPDEVNAGFMLAALLIRVDICRTLLGEWRSTRGTDEQLLSYMQFLLDDIGEGPGRSGAEYVAAMALDSLGRTDEAIAALERAVVAEAHPSAHVALAGFAADRGDAHEAARLLRAGRLTDEQGPGAGLWDEIAPFLRRPKVMAGRNDRCPCGSGRKYKVCHLGKELHPTGERAAWLYRKAMRFAGVHAGELLAAQVGVALDAAEGGHQLLMTLTGSELLFDVTLHEGGVWAQFLAGRAHLLPDDEANLAAQWALVDRSVFELEGPESDRWRARDVRTGDRVMLSKVHGEAMRPGVLLIGRPLPVDDELQPFGGMMPMGQALLDHAIDVLDGGDAEQVAALIGSCMRPPRMTNTDGQTLRFHTLTWTLPDVDAALAGLLSAGFEGAADELSLVGDSMNQHDTVIAFGSITGSYLTLEANSDERTAELIELVRGAVPGSGLFHSDVREFSELMQAGGDPKPGMPPAGADEMMRMVMPQMEQRWVDGPVPALRGMTPREAAADPVARFELERLLDSFPDHDENDFAAMSPARLRALLGL